MPKRTARTKPEDIPETGPTPQMTFRFPRQVRTELEAIIPGVALAEAVDANATAVLVRLIHREFVAQQSQASNPAELIEGTPTEDGREELDASTEVDSAEDDSDRVLAVWKTIRNAWHQALEGHVEISLRELHDAFEQVHQSGAPSTSRQWHIFANDVFFALDEAIPELQNTIFPKIESRGGKLTPAVLKTVNRLFNSIYETMQTPQWADLIAEWEESHA